MSILWLESATEMLQMLFKEAETKPPNERVLSLYFTFCWQPTPGCVSWWDVGYPWSICNLWMEEQILDVCSLYRYSHSYVHHTRTAVVSLSHKLVPYRTSARHAFCQWIYYRWPKTAGFTAQVSFSDELYITSAGITNIHNQHVMHSSSYHLSTFGLEY
jgi:hypothetical protein